VRWDPGDTGGQKNKVNIDKNGYLGHDLGPMAGEISPDMMFCKNNKKHEQNTPDWCSWVSMGVDEWMYAEGSQNKAKRGTNGRSGTCFVLYVSDQKSRKSVRTFTYGQ